MKLSPQDAEEAIWGDHEEWEPLEETKKYIEHARWYILTEMVCQHIPSGKYYLFTWAEPSTESQEGQDRFYGDYEPVEVVKQPLITTEWMYVGFSARVGTVNFLRDVSDGVFTSNVGPQVIADYITENL